MNAKSVQVNELDRPLRWWVVVLMMVYLLLVLSLLVFPAAGDWQWLRGWLYTISITINFAISYAIINQKNPRVIRNRVKVRKSGLTADTQQAASSDRFVYPLMGLSFLGLFIVPGLGHRLGWATLPLAVSIVGIVLANVGLAIVNLATLQNAFASKVLDINEGQELVDSGLYRWVRHPLYAGGILMLLGTPFALGSLWGLIPAFLAVIVLNVRIKFEEEMLIKGMAGYAEYRQRVRYKLLPGVW